MSHPRTKRQFAGDAADPGQRQITSFFTSVTSPTPLTAEPSQRPVLPGNVQSNLLSVGMRVRKSVPEGYKTTSSSAFKIWTDNSSPTHMAPPQRPRHTLTTSSRELLPFCGINRVGGLDIQSFAYDEDDHVPLDIPEFEAIPELTMSQETVDSNDDEVSRKRVFDSEDESDILSVMDGEQSNRRNSSSTGWGVSQRVKAVPRSRFKMKEAVPAFGCEDLKTEGDFEEAGFLIFSDGQNMDVTG